MVNEVYIIDDDATSVKIFKELFRNDKDYKFISVTTEKIDEALKNIPSLIIINEDAIDMDVLKVCKRIRQDEDNSITPVIVVSSDGTREHRLRILNESIEYFVRKPVDEGYLYYTIKNLTRLLTINRRISPLTGLPGNVQIQAEMKKRLGQNKDFAVLYIDLDNFKSYNDVYGFLKGDQIIQFTANVIVDAIHKDASIGNGFVGHIGGDDFIAIISADNDKIEKLCQRIIANFDERVLSFFNEVDVEKGYLQVKNRKGIIENFPLTAISIAVVMAEKNRFANILEIGDAAAQVKHAVKSVNGSSYIIDKRKK